MPRSFALLVLLAGSAACRQEKPTQDGEGLVEDEPPADADGDGYDATEDCDDGNSLVQPGAAEVCDGFDNDCDGVADDGVTSTFYADSDADGFGDAGATAEACELPAGYVVVGTDCDDGDAAIYPGAAEICDGLDNDCDSETDEDSQKTWHPDADGDGYGDGDNPYDTCEPPPGYVADGSDCDDTAAEAFPGGTEVCDELDNDCDGQTDEGVTTTFYADFDGDGYGEASTTTQSCDRPTGYADTSDDCDDADALVNPAAAEICDEIDNDCDGQEDEGSAADAALWYADADGDDHGDPAADAASCEQPAGYVASDDDCDDAEAAVNPDAAEICNDRDDDCNGWIDADDPGLTDGDLYYIDYDADGYGADAYTQVACDLPAGYAETDGDCDDTDAEIRPSAAEICNDLDDDCDGLVDAADDGLTDGYTYYIDEDGDGYGDVAVPLLECEQPDGYVETSTDCDDADAARYPGAPEEWYDGVDSDCDGYDDPDHCLEDPPAAAAGYDEECAYTPSVGAFNPATEWTMSSFSTYTSHKHVISTPTVGQITDDDGDGLRGDADTPDIVIVAFDRDTSSSKGVLRLISGDGSEVHWSAYESTSGALTVAPYRYATTALGDIDGDSVPEIVTTVVSGSTCYAAAYEATGALSWVYTTTAIGCRSHAPALHDLEGDEDVEVIFGNLILNGNGTLQGLGTGGAGYYSSYSNSGYHSFGIDMDADGILEVVAGSTIYDPDGKTICSTGTTDGYPAVADLDGDGLGELVISGNGYVRTFQDDCKAIKSWSVYGGGYGGPPTIADFDGDGTPEIAVAGEEYFTVYEQDGTRLWTTSAITDASSHSTGSSVFDFDGDGDAEVVYADETDLWVFDGATGATIYRDTSHGSGTINEYPVIADVDGDGNAEIVVPDDNTATGLHVIGDQNDEWVSARMTWNQHAYYITNIEDDLTVTAAESSNWPTYNSFRQGAPGGFQAQSAPDLALEAFPACQAACGEDVEIVVQVANAGAARAGTEVELALYGESGGGALTLLDSLPLEAALDPGDLSVGYRFTLSAAETAGYANLLAVIDDGEASNECDEGDNSLEISLEDVCE